MHLTEQHYKNGQVQPNAGDLVKLSVGGPGKSPASLPSIPNIRASILLSEFCTSDVGKLGKCLDYSWVAVSAWFGASTIPAASCNKTRA